MMNISIKGALSPTGHYAPAIHQGDTVYVSGQLPANPFTGERCNGSPAEQAERCLQNLSLLAEAAGASLSQVIRLTIYIADIGQWDEVNGICAQMFGGHKPARTIVPVNQLHSGFSVELDATIGL